VGTTARGSHWVSRSGFVSVRGWSGGELHGGGGRSILWWTVQCDSANSKDSIGGGEKVFVGLYSFGSFVPVPDLDFVATTSHMTSSLCISHPTIDCSFVLPACQCAKLYTNIYIYMYIRCVAVDVKHVQ
jgi:hypothetical protein